MTGTHAIKALFITHDTSNYGASRSLQLLLRNYRGAEIDLLVQRPMRGRIDHEELRSRFGPGVRNIHEAYLPFDPCYQYGRKGFRWRVLYRLYDLLFRSRDRKRIAGIIAAGNYDFIHLNSLVLHPLIDDSRHYILHMRDVYDGSNPAAAENVQKAAGIIFIDEATRAPFREVPLRKSIVLNNPFDMSGVAAYRDFHPAVPDLDPARHTVFSVIGVASEQKGTGFIIRTFLRLRNDSARLLVVGGREQAALAEYRELASGDRRVIFWGEEQEIMRVYAISDYVLRGEAFPCIGRTVYEGLYAGCRVIIPGDRTAPPPMFEADTFRDAVHFYRPRDSEALLELFGRLTGSKVRDRKLRSNLEAYVRAFQEFVITATGAGA
jgi:hypothetical protein